MLSKRNQKKKDTHCVLSFKVLDQTKRICGKRNQNIGLSAFGMAIGKWLEIFWAGGNALCLSTSMSYTGICICKTQ